MRKWTLPAILLLVSLLPVLAGCAAPAEQGKEGEEESGPTGGVSEGGRILLPGPELPAGSAAGGAGPPPVWIVAGGEAVQASYGEFCVGDVCNGEGPPQRMGGDELATAQAPAGEGAFLVVGTDGVDELAAGTVGWGEAPEEAPSGPGVFVEPGIPYYLNALETRPVPEGEGPVVELASGGELEGPTVFEIPSTGNPGDRQLSVFLDKGALHRATYHWRLNPGEEGENPPPQQPKFSGEVVEITRGAGTGIHPPEEAREELAVRSVEEVPLAFSPRRVEAGEGYLWVVEQRELQIPPDELGGLGKAKVRNTGFVVLKVDPESGEAVAETDLLGAGPGAGRGFSVGAGAVWFAANEPGRVLRLDTGSGEVVREIPTGGGHPTGVVATGDAVWVATYDDTQSGRVLRMDPETNETVAEIETPGIAESLAVDEESGDVWVVSLDQTGGAIDYESNQLLRIDPGTNEISERFEVEGGIRNVTAGGGALWAGTGVGGDQALAKLNPRTREIEDVVSGVSEAGPNASKIGAGALWVLGRGELTRIDLESGEPSGTVGIGGYEDQGLAVDEDSVWVVSAGRGPGEGGTLTHITP